MKKIISALLLLTAFAVCSLPMAYAADTPSAFSVSAVPNEAQISSETYFDLRMPPNDTRTLQLKITNAESVPIVASVELNPATTSTNGVISYAKTDSVSADMKIPVTEIAHVREPETTIPANSSAFVNIDVAMPEVEMDGVILGGLRVTARYENPPGETANNEGIRIENKFAYVVGLKITQNEMVVSPDFTLESIKPELVNYSTSVVIRVRNTEAAIAKNVAFTAHVYKEGAATALRELVLNNAEMAPDSGCGFVVDWNNRRIDPGQYRASVRMQHGDKVWEWSETFTVEKSVSDDINNGALGIVRGTFIPTWMIWLFGLPLLLLFVLFAYAAGRRRRGSRAAGGV